MRAVDALLLAASATLPRVANAQPTNPAAASPAISQVTPSGYVEGYYAYNFARPGNGITNYRGFDNRHNTFSITNAALGVTWERERISAKLLMQVGSAPSTYYLSEPASLGTPG